MPTSPSGGNQYASVAEVIDANLSEQYHDEQYYSVPPDCWYLDSGASAHIATDRSKLDTEPSTSRSRRDVKTGGGEKHTIRGTDSSTLRTSAGKIKLDNVHYVPSMRKNLMSVGSITDTRQRILFSSTHCWILKGYQVVATGFRNRANGLYYFHEEQQALSAELTDEVATWHRRLGHLSYVGLSFLSKSPHTIDIPESTRHHKYVHVA